MKVLGLDIGTNSIGWGIVDERNHQIENCGVYIFPEGVKIEKGNESSKAAERTSYYAFYIDPEVRAFVAGLSKDKVGKIVNFGSAALLIRKLRRKLLRLALQWTKKNSTVRGNSKVCIRVDQTKMILRQLLSL